MLLCNAHKNSQGFTVLETLIILLIIGTLSAIAIPSFLDLSNRGKVNNAVAQVQGALQEAHRVAMRRSKTCRVALTTGNQPKLTSNCFDIADYIIEASAGKNLGSTTINVKNLPVAISSGTGLVFSNGATGVVSVDAAKGSTSLTLFSNGISKPIVNGEIVELRTLPDGVALATNIKADPTVPGTGSPIQIQIGFRGNTKFDVEPGNSTNNTTANILLYQSNGSTSNKKCVALSNGIGILRSGTYKVHNQTPDNITDGTCEQALQ